MIFLLRESPTLGLRVRLRRNRMRSFLTSLGIIVGVASVIAVISLVQGLSRSVTDQFQGLGGNTLTVKAHNDFKDVMRGKRNALRFDDVEQLQTRVDEIREVSPRVFPRKREYPVSCPTASMPRYSPSPASYQDVRQSYTQSGRFLDRRRRGQRAPGGRDRRKTDRTARTARQSARFLHPHSQGVVQGRGLAGATRRTVRHQPRTTTCSCPIKTERSPSAGSSRQARYLWITFSRSTTH